MTATSETTERQVPIETTDGREGVKQGKVIRWEDGKVSEILDTDFPPLRQGGRVIQRSMLVRESDGSESFLTLIADEWA